METNRLVQFCVVVEIGNLRKAAQILKISHGALSKSLKVLEIQLKTELFQQAGRGLKVTDNGLKVYSKSQQIAQLVKELTVQTAKPQEQIVRLGTFEIFSTYFLPKLINQHLGHASLELHELLPGKLEEAIEANVLDFGITLEPSTRKNIEFLKLSQITMGIFAKRGRYKDTPFDQIPFAAPVNPIVSLTSNIRGLDGWPDLEFSRYVKYRVDMIESALELAREGLCALFIPRFFAGLQNKRLITNDQLEEIDGPTKMKPIKRDVYLVKRESSIESREMKIVAKAIRQICRS